jgi:hypothetical protein
MPTTILRRLRTALRALALFVNVVVRPNKVASLFLALMLAGLVGAYAAQHQEAADDATVAACLALIDQTGVGALKTAQCADAFTIQNRRSEKADAAARAAAQGDRREAERRAAVARFFRLRPGYTCDRVGSETRCWYGLVESR